MKLHYTVTEQAYLDFSIYHAEHSDTVRKAVRRARIRLPILLSFMVLGFCVWMINEFGISRLSSAFQISSAPSTLIGILTVAVLWYALYPVVYRKVMERYFKAYIAEGNGKEFTGDFTLELSVDRLRVEGVKGVTESLYGSVEKLVENKGFLYVYTGGMSAFILPLDAFDSEEAYREFRGRLEEKVQAAREVHDGKGETQTGGKPQQQG